MFEESTSPVLELRKPKKEFDLPDRSIALLERDLFLLDFIVLVEDVFRPGLIDRERVCGSFIFEAYILFAVFSLWLLTCAQKLRTPLIDSCKLKTVVPGKIPCQLYCLASHTPLPLLRDYFPLFSSWVGVLLSTKPFETKF